MTAQPRDDARIDERGRCSPRGPDHPPSGDVQFVPMLTSFAGRAGMLRQASAGIGFPRAVRGPAAAPWATTLRGRLASVRLGPSGRVSPPSSPSVPSREAPGLGPRRPAYSRGPSGPWEEVGIVMVELGSWSRATTL